jgi:hypothetical protein
VKSLTFGLKRSDKKGEELRNVSESMVKILKGDSFSKVEEGEIEKINKEEEESKRLENKEDNKFLCCFKTNIWTLNNKLFDNNNKLFYLLWMVEILV